MRKIWDQQYRIEEKDGQSQVFWRGSGQLPPASQLILSPYETEARYCVRSEQKWEGYRVHFTETCDEAAELHLITPAGVETAPAPEQDDTAPPRIHAALQQRSLLPHEHLVDAGSRSVSVDLLV